MSGTRTDAFKNKLGELALVNGWNSFREPFGSGMTCQKGNDTLNIDFNLNSTIRCASFNDLELPPSSRLVCAILG
jgi:hypothetical protein